MKFPKPGYGLLICASMLCGTDAVADSLGLADTGYIPVWLVAGPFEQSLTGFGQAADDDLINETAIAPYEGKTESSSLAESGVVSWQVQSIENDGYLDFNTIIGHTRLGRNPEKLWYATDAFASAKIFCENKKSAKLLLGSNSRMKIWLNGVPIYQSIRERGAIADQDSIPVQLRKGENHILVRVGNSQNNLVIDWFGGTPWGWEFFLKIVNADQTVPSGIQVIKPTKNDRYNCDLESTFFFKKIDNQLFQRIDVTIYSPLATDVSATLMLEFDGKQYDFDFNKISCGENRREIYIPALEEDKQITCTTTIDDQKIKKKKILKQQNRYEFYVVMTSHMDIGYTNTQPVVKERHIQTMLDVLDKCRKDSEFHWMVETPWILDLFEKTVPKATFDEFMSFVSTGQIGVSPIFTNPYTGWISREEMIRAFDKAAEYHARYGVDFSAAMVNDLPGLSWIIPQMLKNTGTGFLACGINEIYNDYRLQRELPKVFYWEGADDSRVMTYITNAYTEGRYLGMEKSPQAVEQLIWKKINRLKAYDYPYEKVLINTVFSDNAGIPNDQYSMINTWNSIYEYPKFRSATLGEFAAEFEAQYSDQLPVLKGDWTSDWDILYQSEPKEFIRYRKIQHDLLSVEKLSTINWLLDSSVEPQCSMFQNCYELLLNFSGHGSGLEFGFGSPEDNISTMAFRKGYIDQAELQAEELRQRAVYRFAVPHASFETEGVIVFNSLSWKCDRVVELHFREGRDLSFDIYDLSTGNSVPHFAEGHKVWFIARDLPSLGFKKYQMKPTLKTTQVSDSDLILTENSIENRFYLIKYDINNNRISGIIDKNTRRNLIGNTDQYHFAQPVLKRGTQHDGFKSVEQGNARWEIIDERPVRLVLRVQYENELFEATDFILWSEMEKIDVDQSVDLSKLSKTDIVEEYGLAFPFELKNAQAMIEIIGGFLDPEKDRLPGIEHNAYSIRRTVALSDKSSSLIWASMDCRVVRLEYDNKRPVLISNVVNNFPEQWNRRQDNSGKLILRYSLTLAEAEFRAGLSTKFGWETLTTPLLQQGWFSTSKPTGSYFTFSNSNVILYNLRKTAGQNTWQMELLNCNPVHAENVIIQSDFFKNREIVLTDCLDNTHAMIPILNNRINITIPGNTVYLLTVK